MEKYHGDYTDKGWSGYWISEGYFADTQIISPTLLRDYPDKFDWVELPEKTEETDPSTNSEGKLWPHLGGKALTYVFYD